MATRYLVTGGSGFLGSAIVRALVKSGAHVRVFDNNSRGRTRRLHDLFDEIEFIEGDIRDADGVRRAVRGVDEVLHLAFLNGTEFFYLYPELVLDVGIRGMLSVLDACRSEEVGRLVVASSSEAYHQPSTVPTPETVPLVVPDVMNPRYSYGGGKLCTELMAINWGRKGFDRVMIFRPHNIYGPDMGWEHVIPQFAMQLVDLMRNQPEGVLNFEIKGGGDQARAFCYVDDFVCGLMAMLDKGSHLNIYNIGNPDEITISDLARNMARHFRRELLIQSGDAFAGETLRRCPDITKLSALGYTPLVPLKEGLAKTLSWYAANIQLRDDRLNLTRRREEIT